MVLTMYRFYTTRHYKKTNLAIDELKQRLIDIWDRISSGTIVETNGEHGCVHV